MVFCLVYGTTTRQNWTQYQELKLQGHVACMRCQYQPVAVVEHWKYFHICFIPLLPLSYWYTVICPCCQQHQQQLQQRVQRTVGGRITPLPTLTLDKHIAESTALYGPNGPVPPASPQSAAPTMVGTTGVVSAANADSDMVENTTTTHRPERRCDGYTTIVAEEGDGDGGGMTEMCLTTMGSKAAQQLSVGVEEEEDNVENGRRAPPDFTEKQPFVVEDDKAGVMA